MNLKRFFSKRKVSSTETRSTGPSSQPEGETSESSPMSSSNAANGIQAVLNDSSEANLVPQSINRTPNDHPDPVLSNTDKVLSALQGVAGMVLPLGLPEIAKSASHLLTMVENKRRNDGSVEELRVLALDISKIILAFVKPLEENPAGTIEQKEIVDNVSSYLKRLHDLYNEYRQQNSLSQFISGSAWKDKIDGISRGIQTQLILVNTTAVLEVLNRFNSPSASRETPGDQAFENAVIKGRVNNFTQSGLNQSLATPRNQGHSKAFKGATIGENAHVNNHHQHFGQHAPW